MLPHNPQLGVILVDHGSRRAESNNLLLEVVENFAAASGYSIVEPAHIELAEPSIATAFRRCVERGATTVFVFPYSLLPARLAGPNSTVRFRTLATFHDRIAQGPVFAAEGCVPVRCRWVGRGQRVPASPGRLARGRVPGPVRNRLGYSRRSKVARPKRPG